MKLVTEQNIEEAVPLNLLELSRMGGRYQSA